MAQEPFWRRKTLEQMNRSEWEQLCDGCGRCCLHSLEDEDTGEVYLTNVACRLLDTHSCQCSKYSQRKAHVPGCIQLRIEDIAEFDWLPLTCAYRSLAEGRPLADWHPLVSGDPESVHRAGISVHGRVVSEESVHPDDMEDHIVSWVEQG
ncbi:YcgN family cysteine cluster protein [Microbulbifer sp. A4B17]|uniref:YcgN family cysteine cluster protein n=1 Tax=Microbulbifer sp. A4B17 TaxID=359370 RepID=UPI000D52D13B|nr:YcgN family cysteine cluster protein [Microbulbifer sp. A4B17]AWF80052.1 YcgN family cysteine cluster protein [Microbulbifer sp. A4B17]